MCKGIGSQGGCPRVGASMQLCVQEVRARPHTPLSMAARAQACTHTCASVHRHRDPQWVLEGPGQTSSATTPWGSGTHNGTACQRCRREPPGWEQCWAGAQLCAWHCFCRAPARQRSGKQGLSALKGAGRAPGPDGNEAPGVRTAQRHPLGWAETFPAPRHSVCKYRRPLTAGPPAGRARGAPGIPLRLGAPRAPRRAGGVRARHGAQPWAWQCPTDAPWHPIWQGQGGQGLPIAFVGGPSTGAGGAGSGGEECPRSMPTMLGLTALKSGCHIPSGQPFTSICGGLVRLPSHSANTNTALNPSAPTVPGCRAGQLQATHRAPGRAAAILLQHPSG